jgi:hypothetical protein
MCAFAEDSGDRGVVVSKEGEDIIGAIAVYDFTCTAGCCCGCRDGCGVCCGLCYAVGGC